MTSPSLEVAKPLDHSSQATSFDVEVYFDGDCPLCVREIRMLQRLDRKHRISFVNIAAEDFSPQALGTTMSSLMSQIRAKLPDGTWIEGVEVFRRLYSAIGFGLLVSLTRLPGVKWLLDVAYGYFAKNRLRFTGRCQTVNSSCQIGGP
jgi:predicted DCC family thiol-disulfide oxidoreductase YuxK